MPRADSQRLTPRRVVTSDRTTNTARFVPTNSITRFIFVFRLRPRVTSTQQAQSQIPDLLTFRRRSRQIGADDKRSRRLVGPACANNCPSQKLKTCLCSIRANRALLACSVALRRAQAVTGGVTMEKLSQFDIRVQTSSSKTRSNRVRFRVVPLAI